MYVAHINICTRYVHVYAYVCTSSCILVLPKLIQEYEVQTNPTRAGSRPAPASSPSRREAAPSTRSAESSPPQESGKHNNRNVTLKHRF